MKKKKLIWQIPFLLILIIGTIIIIRQQHNTPYQKDTGFILEPSITLPIRVIPTTSKR